MSGARDQVGRLLALVPYIQTRREVPLEQAAVDLGVAPGQLVRDLNVLWYCGLPGLGMGELIDVDMDALEGDGVIRVSNADYLARPLRLTSAEASALIVALRTLRDSAEEAVTDVVARTLTKLEAAAEDGAALAEQVQVSLGEDTRELDRLRVQLSVATTRGRRVRIRYYVPARDESTERVVDPLKVVTAGGQTYLDAWCHLAEGQRLFRLDRILAAETLDDAVDDRPDVAPRDLSAGLFQPAADDTRATLRLQPRARWVAEYYPVESTVERAGGTLEVTLLVGDPRWLRRLMLRLAPYAEVVAPAEFTESLLADARAALGLYGDRGVPWESNLPST